ncbi:MAG: hypothetical protein R3246_11590, partial [Acidimicrobiia bacterium]|nr:hypothetical protein [Acidimicrobiia bacterium]
MTGLEPEPSEAAVVRSFDPADDLHRRARAWGHELEHHRLDALALFAAGLALAEADAWTEDRRDEAMRAFVDRRHLVSDRI